MGMTIAEKILARASGKSSVSPGEYLWAKTESTSIMGGQIYKDLQRLNIKKLFDPDRIYVTEDHCAPASTVSAANASIEMRQLVKDYHITHFYEWGRHGITHELFPDHGYVSPGDFIASIDSHSTSYGCFNAASCSIHEELLYLLVTGKVWLRVPSTIKFHLTGQLPGADSFVVGKDLILHIAGKYGTDFALYQSIEYAGPAISTISMPGRFSIANMSAELGAKFAIFPYDDKTACYLKDKMDRPARPTCADEDAVYETIHYLNLTDLSPYVALPDSPANSFPVGQITKDQIKIDQAFIGSCVNGRMEDFRMAAKILKNKKIASHVRLIATPASQRIWQQCLKEGIWEIFSEAGCLVTHATCGACAGIHNGVLGDGEICLSTTNRNFKGRMGSNKASIYLANSATVAASAIAGYIADPRELL